MRPDEIIFRSKPLFLDDSGNLVLGKHNTLLRRTVGGELEVLTKIPSSLGMRVMSYSRWCKRLLRLGFGTGVCFRGIYFFTFNSKIYRYDPVLGLLSQEFAFINGRGPLSLTVIEGIAQFEDGVYFGEYINNPNRNSVKIYKRDESANWNVVFKFESNIINHIHSLVADAYRNCVWILTGDFDHSAGIWMAKNDFKEVTSIVAGQQIYRACVAFPIVDGLLYATDTQLSDNSIRLLFQRNGVWESEHLFETNGSCIYGCNLRDYFIFSTATEPAEETASNHKSLLDRKPGPGIKRNLSDVIAIRKSDLNFAILFSKEKDWLPYRSFQFGAILFPSGVSSENILYAYSVANKTNDMSTEVYNVPPF